VPKYKAALGAAYGAGLRVSEVFALKVRPVKFRACGEVDQRTATAVVGLVRSGSKAQREQISSALPPIATGEQKSRIGGSVPTTDSRLQRYRLRFRSFGHPKGEDDQCHRRGSASGEKGGTVSEMIDDHASS
jgi:hypothetical protein